MQSLRKLTRRQAIRLAGVAGGLGALAAVAPKMVLANGRPLKPTPSQAEGPFYPLNKPARPDNNLHQGPDGKLAEGDPLELTGRVLNQAGEPVAGAMVEIWQCDNRAIYRHPRADHQGREDPLFAGYGEMTTGPNGGFTFLTIVPVAYPGRPPHIHAKVRQPGGTLTTQLYLAGHPDNDRDGLLARIFERGRERLMMKLRDGGRVGGQAAKLASFDFVV